MTQVSAPPVAARVERSERVKRGNRRGKNIMTGDRVESSLQGSIRRNSKPAKATFGELFEFTSKGRIEEKIVPSSSTLDVHTNSAVRVDRRLTGWDNQGSQSKQLKETMEVGRQSCDAVGVGEEMREPEVEKQDVQALGRPPDCASDDLVRTTDGTIEEIGNEMDNSVSRGNEMGMSEF